MLVEAKQQELAASLLKSLLNKYRDEENPDQSIEIIKKILEYTPFDNSARRELVKLYEKKYAEHSQYQQFLKLSKLNNFKYPVKHAIQDFEKNIVFDKDNFVFHRSWGVGKITGLDSEGIIIDFRSKENHKMSIQMALQSLAPINNDHLYAIEYEDPDILKNYFNDDFNKFFEVLLKSYNGHVTLFDIKKELIPKFVEEKNWSKWWSRARTVIKKNPNFGISESKKNEIYLRDKPMTFAEELLNNFINSDSFSKKLDIAIEFTNNIEHEEGSPVIQFFIDYFSGQGKNESHTKQILSYFILGGFSKFVDAKKLKLSLIREKIVEFIKESNELPLISIKIDSYDYKKDFVNLIEETREDWPQVVAEFLIETPVRVHKYIINNLIRANAYNIINKFIDRSTTGAKENPEIFLWVSKNLLTEVWDYDWLDYSRETLVLTLFRLLNELKKIEIKGNRLKNMAVEILFNNEDEVLKDIIESSNETFLSKIYDIFSNVSYIEESNVNKFSSLITKKYAEFKVTVSTAKDENWEREVEKLIVSREGYDKMNAELNRMVSVDMITLSKELSKVADVSGDARENVDYNALMEKQTILKMTISKLQDELKKAVILDLNNVSIENVNIGTSVKFENPDSGEKGNYIILGPWDADYEKKILSYRSPMAMALLGKKAGDEVNMKIGDETRRFKINSIEKYSG
jgi:transcription elongation factor GreA